MSSDKEKSSNTGMSLLQRIQELRVADHELRVGKGAVYMQLSAGAVAFLTDRPVAQARVSRKLRQAVQEHEKLNE